MVSAAHTAHVSSLLDELSMAIHESARDSRWGRVQFVRALLALVNRLGARAHARLVDGPVYDVCCAEVHAWLVEDTISEEDTWSLLRWSVRYRVDLEAVEAELVRVVEATLRDLDDVIDDAVELALERDGGGL